MRRVRFETSARCAGMVRGTAAGLAAAGLLTATATASAEPPSLQAAFAAVYPRARITAEMNGEDARFDMKPLAVYPVSVDTFALVSAGRFVGQASHMDGGYASVAYLKTGPRLVLEGKPFHLEGTMGGFGEPPHVSLLAGVSREPLLQVETGFYNQGQGDSSAYLVALGPTIRSVAVVGEHIALSHTIGATGDDGCDIDGKIVPLVEDKAFEVRYSGSYTSRQRYKRVGRRWVADPPARDLSDRCR